MLTIIRSKDKHFNCHIIPENCSFFFTVLIIADIRNSCSFSSLKYLFLHLYHNVVLNYFSNLVSFFISAGFITAIQNEIELQYKVIHQKISILTIKNKYCLHLPSKKCTHVKGKKEKLSLGHTTL